MSAAPDGAAIAMCRHELRRIRIIKRLVETTVEGTLGAYEEFRVFNFDMYRSTLRRIVRGSELLPHALSRFNLTLDSPDLRITYVESACAPHFYEAGEVTSLIDLRERGHKLWMHVAQHISHDAVRCAGFCCLSGPVRLFDDNGVCSLCARHAHEPCACARPVDMVHNMLCLDCQFKHDYDDRFA